MQRSYFLSVCIAFLLLSGLVFLLHLQNLRFDFLPLIISNVLFGVASIVSFLKIKKGLDSPNGYALIRAKYRAMLLKFFLCIAIIVGYIFWIGRANVYKPAVFLLLGMYIVYSALEAIPLAKSARKSSK